MTETEARADSVQKLEKNTETYGPIWTNGHLIYGLLSEVFINNKYKENKSKAHLLIVGFKIKQNLGGYYGINRHKI